MDAEVAVLLRDAFRDQRTDPIPVGDWHTRRTVIDALYTRFASRFESSQDITVIPMFAEAADGTSIPLRLYTPEDPAPNAPLVVYIHGGGMFCCSVDTHDPVVRYYAAESAVKFLSVDYRLSPEYPYPFSVEDCYSALTWASEHAELLGIDPSRIAIAGDSAGGGIAAAVAIMTRDKSGPTIAKQVLIYPMLDDRTTVTDTAIAPFAVWSYEDNITGWETLLGGRAGGPDVPAWAAPARETHFEGLPPAYVEVGTLDIFRDESIRYASNLVQAGIPTELHLHDGVPHCFELFAPSSSIARRALADRVRIFTDIPST
jgi:acetyl esterase/lipase